MNNFLLSSLFLLLYSYCFAQPVGPNGQYNVRFANTEVNFTTDKFLFDVEIKADADSTNFFVADMNFRFSFNRSVFGDSSLDIVEELTLSSFTTDPGNNGAFSFYNDHTTTGSIDTVCSYNIPLGGGPGYLLNETEWVKVGRLSLDIITYDEEAFLLYHCPDDEFPYMSVNGKDGYYPDSSNEYLYTATAANGMACSDMTVSIPPNPNLPVSLYEFKAALQTNRTVKLDWSSESELNLSHYEVERRTDGFDFQRLESVTATGSPDLAQSYTTVDEFPQNGVNYYRLKMMDENGEFAYSKVVIVKLKRDLGLEVFPNPADTEIAINITGSPSPTINLTIINALGQTVEQMVIDKGAFVDYSTRMDVSHLTPGTYFLSISNDTHAIHRKFLVQH